MCGMTAAPPRSISVADYLAMERAANEKHALWDGEVFAMAGASPSHNLLVAAVLGELGVRLRGRPCRPYASDQRVRIPGGKRYVYPDASVVCAPRELDPIDDATIVNPRLVVEVLSPSTEAFDRGEKFIAYRTIPSLTDYLLLAQDKPLAEHYAREPDGSWRLRASDLEGSVLLASIDVEIAVRDLYDGVLEAG